MVLVGRTCVASCASLAQTSRRMARSSRRRSAAFPRSFRQALGRLVAIDVLWRFGDRELVAAHVTLTACQAS